MKAFSESIRSWNFQDIKNQIANQSARDVSDAVARAANLESLNLNDLLSLLSTHAANHIEELAQAARSVTRQRHGNTIQIYAPMYLSNECRSTCTYCGFSYKNEIKRRTLTVPEVLTEAEILLAQGIRHVLLLTGEDYKNTPVSYLAEVANALKQKFSSISIEVYPLKQEHYSLLRQTGVDGLAVYQETYDPDRYREVHLRGVKKNMEFRLDCPDRAGQAGIRKIAIGALLGLSDPAADVFFTALHGRHIMKEYWQTGLSISLPRLRPAEGLDFVPHISDRSYLQYLCALRLFFPDAGLILSTRENSQFRDRVAEICVTQMSAGSKTEPGGYSGMDTTVQFETEDRRSIQAFTNSLKEMGLEPVFTDWSGVLK